MDKLPQQRMERMMGIPEWNATWISPELGGARFDHTTQQVAAVSRAPGNLDVFVLGFDNQLWTAWWDGRWHGWDQLQLGGARFDHTTQQVAAVSRAELNLDVFVLGFDNRMWTAFWGEQAVRPKISLRAIAPAGEGRFIEVTGNEFAPVNTVSLAYDIRGGGGPTTHQTGEDKVTTSRDGGFVHPIKANLGGDVSGAQVRATDMATGLTTDASI
jgi:hypothetical protein